MSSPDIHPAADRFPCLLRFFDLFNTGLSLDEEALSINGGTGPADRKRLKSLYEESLSFLENRAAELAFRDDLLELQRGLYKELEFLCSLDRPDSRHHFFIVVPVADRPSMLRNCVESLIGQCEDFLYGGTAVDSDGNRVFRKVSLFLIDDSADEGNRAQIREIAAAAGSKGIRSCYVGVDEQADLLRQIGLFAGEASSRLTGSPGNTPSGHKGASVTRNLAYLYLNSFLRGRDKDEKVLIYFLDSDEEFGIRVQKNGVGADIRFINYFYWLDRIFSTTGIQVLTGKVVGDPPVSSSVMINTFLDDVLLFLETVSRTRPDEACPFHQGRRSGHFSAEYHDMVELFGYQRPGAMGYNCPLSGDHTSGDCFRAFSMGVPDFFHGLHPTRVQFYHHSASFTKTEAARTVYTGNYVFTPEALKYFIPFADLKLRMAGPALGRILRSGIGKRFASVNMPLLHRRTSPDSSRVYRSGISGTKDSIDLSGEFIRQFWGDVMLFSVESLTRSGFPGKKPDFAEISSVVKSVQDDLWKLYREQKAAAANKARAVIDRLLQADSWWNRGRDLKDAVRKIELLCFIVYDNFGEGAQSMRSLSGQIAAGTCTDLLIQAIGSFHDDESVWKKLIEADCLLPGGEELNPNRKA
jgi:hypothetical protein